MCDAVVLPSSPAFGGEDLGNLRCAGAVHDVELNIFPVSAFESLDISGEKDYPRQDGSVIKLSYREAFFHLVEFMIAE